MGDPGYARWAYPSLVDVCDVDWRRRLLARSCFPVLASLASTAQFVVMRPIRVEQNVNHFFDNRFRIRLGD